MSEATGIRHLGNIRVKGLLETLTGLHIGGTEVGLAIGGADNTVVRNGLDGQPYIPGSSLKGKMRCLLERVYRADSLKRVGQSRIHVCNNLQDYEACFVCHLFGVTPEDIRRLQGESMPTRLLVRDARMTPETAEALERSLYTDMPYTQVKTEVVIDRITSAATPRQMERVPAGALFEYEVVFNVYREGDLDWLSFLVEAMDLLEHDYLGGQGSRGYGQVRFKTRAVEATAFNGFGLQGDPRFKKFVQLVERPAGE